MQTQFLLQVGLVGVFLGLSEIGFAHLMCLSDGEMVAGSYRLQEPSGLYSGEIPDGSFVLRIYLQPNKKREVFGLGSAFEIQENGKWITPVFVCLEDHPVWYQLPHYKVGCPRVPDGPVEVIADSLELFKVGSFDLSYWTQTCVALRRVKYECFQPKIYPDLPPRPRSGYGYIPMHELTFDPRNYDVPHQCAARHTIQFMTALPANRPSPTD